jgi:flavin reductase (DIM6/NTAB) family NADH-FMN oxidoreductase RutF
VLHGGAAGAHQHHTCANIERNGEFTVSYPKPSQVVYAALAASPRFAGGPKTVLQSFATFPAKKIDGEFIEDAYLFLECKHYKTIDGFGDNCLISGEVVAAYAHPDRGDLPRLRDQMRFRSRPI